MATHSLRIVLFAQRREQRIVSQLLMVIQVLVAQTQPIDPLGEQSSYRVLPVARIAPVDEAGGEPVEYPRASIQFSQQERSALAADRPAVKGGRHSSSTKALKVKLFWCTLYLTDGPYLSD